MNHQDTKAPRDNETTEDTEKAQRSQEKPIPSTGRLKRATRNIQAIVQKKSSPDLRPFVSALTGTVGASKEVTRSTGKKIVDHATAAIQSSRRAGRSGASQATILLNAILASDFSKSMESWLGKTFNEGVPSVYDAAVDAVYNTTHVGGGHLHRLFDESHSPWSMWGKVHDALPDDTFAQEVVGYTTALWKDLSSSVGIPLFDWNKTSYDRVADLLRDTFHIPKSWFADLLHVNTVELIGSVIATIAVTLRWNKAEVQEFSEMAASIGISSLASANPALALVALAVLAKSYTDAREKQSYKDMIYGLSRGGVGTAVFLATASIVSGPIWVGLLVGICAGSVSRKGLEEARAHEICDLIKTSLGQACKAVRPGASDESD